MRILILAAGPDIETVEGAYPSLLSELDGGLLIERIVERCKRFPSATSLWALRSAEIRRYHIDNVLAQLDPTARLIRVEHETRGAACTALLATAEIDNDQPLLIMNSTDHVEAPIEKAFEDFAARKLDAGVIVFPSVHPRYSYVKVNADGIVVEAAEKNPISKHATAGHYWFARGSDFVNAARRMIRKDAEVNGRFYICPVLNEMILDQARIGIHAISAKQYYPLKTREHVQRYELHTHEEARR